MREREREMRRRRQRRMKRLKRRLHEQMVHADSIRAERAVEKQRKRMKRVAAAGELPSEGTE